MKLNQLGWNSFFNEAYEAVKKENYVPGRIIREDKGQYMIQHESGLSKGQVSGKLRHNATSSSDYPSVGDWILMTLTNNNENAIIYHVLNRKSSFTRKAPISGGRKVKDICGRKVTQGGSTEEQVIAANIDIVFIVIAADDNYNLRRLERYLLMAWNSGAQPVIVMNKIDVCHDLSKIQNGIKTLTSDVPTHYISATQNENIHELKSYIKEGVTIALIGSSGVGKSTMINCF